MSERLRNEMASQGRMIEVVTRMLDVGLTTVVGAAAAGVARGYRDVPLVSSSSDICDVGICEIECKGPQRAGCWTDDVRQGEYRGFLGIIPRFEKEALEVHVVHCLCAGVLDNEVALGVQRM